MPKKKYQYRQITLLFPNVAPVYVLERRNKEEPAWKWWLSTQDFLFFGFLIGKLKIRLQSAFEVTEQ